MKFYYAPMEGVVGYIYRNAHRAHFDHVDQYYAPFIVADQTDGFRTKDKNDILPENNQRLILVPQILSNNAQDFIHTSKKIKAYGYKEINLNLGCPFGTVVSKKRGAGFLALREELDLFLDQVFSRGITEISVKTRVGKEKHDEFYELIEIFNKYPIKELTIHPRIQTDMYKNKPDMAIFKEGLAMSKNPVVYNGDIFTVKDYLEFTTAFPQVDAVMLGRGLLTNPMLIEQIKTGKTLDKETLRSFHDQILAGYQDYLSGDRNVLFKMKEVWFYMSQAFTDYEKYFKKIRKAEKLIDYQDAVARLFEEQEIRREFGYSK